MTVKTNPFELPRFDLDAVVAMQRANLHTFVQAQKILTDAAQGIAKAQAGYVNEIVAQMQGAMARKDAKRSDAYLAEMRAAAERAVTVATEQFGLGTKAQSEVVDLLTKRAVANFEHVKTMAA